MKKNLIYILMILAVALLITNVIIRVLNESEPEVVVKELSSSEIDSIFVNTLNEFKLDSLWVNKVFINSKEYDSLNYVYKIQLPSDLPPVLVLQDLRKAFINKEVDLLSDEKIVNGYTTINIFSKDHLKLQATFMVETDRVRPHTKLSLVIKNPEELEETELINQLRSVIDLNFLLIPSASTDTLISKIADYKKTYSILISDDENESNYQIDPSGSKTLIKEAIRLIIRNYPDAHLFLIDSSSKTFNSPTYNFVEDEFNARGANLEPLTQFVELPKDIQEAKSLLTFYLESEVGKLGKVLIIPAEIYMELEPSLLKEKKKGAKFYSPKKLRSQNHQIETLN